jgi:hypothetical protein
MSIIYWFIASSISEHSFPEGRTSVIQVAGRAVLPDATRLVAGFAFFDGDGREVDSY